MPGVRDYEEQAYWRDVGTLRALALARRDVAGARPRLDLRNTLWPVRRDLVTASPLPSPVTAPDRAIDGGRGQPTPAGVGASVFAYQSTIERQISSADSANANR